MTSLNFSGATQAPRAALTRLAIAVTTTLLSACGGGGTVPAPVAATVPAPVAVVPVPVALPSAFDNLYQPLQTSVPASPYVGRDLEEFNTLNRQRGQCGFGLLAHHDSLRAAATDHAHYINLNGNKVLAAGLSLHEQFTQFPNGFTGFTVADRVRYRGYLSPSLGEVIAGSVASTSAVHGLLSAPYHAGAVLGGQTEVGIAGGSGSAIVMEFGLPAKRQRAGDGILTYPCQGVTGTQLSLSAETPSPYSPRNLAASPIGQAVYFLADLSVPLAAGRKTQLDVTDLSMSESLSGAEVRMLAVMTRESDPNFIYLNPGFAYAAPDKPLKPLTAYRVQATVLAGGKTTRVDYTFTTGAGG